MKRFLIVAGEASGDMHAADLVRHALSHEPDAQFFGLGGPKMAKAGVDLLHDPTRHSSTGITEILSAIPKLYPYFTKLVHAARERHCDAAILVDWPEFNLRLAKRLKKAGVRVIYYISPQLWAWRAWRVKEVRRWVDEMLVLFHFEVDFYRKHGVQARFVGHPLVDQMAAIAPDPRFRASLGIPSDHRLIGLLPGSRRKEVGHLYPAFAAAARILHQQDPRLSFALGKSPNVPDDCFQNSGQLTVDSGQWGPSTVHRPPSTAYRPPSTAYRPLVHRVHGGAHQVMANSDLLLIASGTATLEAAILGTPMIVAYRASPITFHICKPLKKSKYMALVNILADSPIVPELLQYQATAQRLAETAKRMLGDGQLADTQKRLKRACKLLGEPGASNRAALEVLKIVS